MCEMIFTSDEEFFREIGVEETKKYFEESYNFISNYKDLGEENIISAVVHLDEGVPHMHLVYVPVIHTKDKNGNEIDKVCCRDFWKGRDSYRNLQDAYYDYITSKGFNLQRGLPSEETGRSHETIQDYKRLTNFENTKKVLESVTLELPDVPNINDVKLVKLNKEKIKDEIIKPKDDLINQLHKENLSLKKELSKQVKVVDEATKYIKDRNNILNENNSLNNEIEKLKNDYEIKLDNMKYSYNKKIDELQKQVVFLESVIERFKYTINKFIHWVCNKFSVSSEDTIIRDFENETENSFEVEKQIEYEQDIENDDYLEF